MRRLFWVVLVVVLVCGCEQEAPDLSKLIDETEVPDDAVQIDSATKLARIGRNKNYPLNGRYVLTADLTLNDWTPIPDDFGGEFDGAEHTITITEMKDGSASGGLFGALYGATVRNLTVKVTAEIDPDDSRTASAGGIAAFAEWSLIENCTAVVDLSVTGYGHNAAVGGIVGNIRSNTTVRNCTASGTIALSSELDEGLMVYAGGVVGYAGTGTAGSGASGCVITGSQWVGETSTVSASGGYPYAGGVVGYNYTGARVAQCRAEGAVSATGGNLPYAGGVAGYNSGYVEGTSPAVVSLIEDCFSTATVSAVSESKAALAGGVVGANAKRARVLRCYARGAVTAQVTGSSINGLGGSIGVMVAANAGGIAGAQYVEQNPSIEQCAALNPSVTGADSDTDDAGDDSEAEWNVYRIAGAGVADSDTGLFVNNIAFEEMDATPHGADWFKTGDGKDGANIADEKPGRSVYEDDLGWDFDSVWRMDEGYPVLGD